ncbi:MAG TPA: hypothetical protein VFO11_02840, partial [Candidatus Polarisedimenticolaceae bacterium]|nr:hypothetical protein [Candidatus Polarisedimenticolaceae bacterium]
DRSGIVLRMGSTDPTVGCIPTPIVSFGSLAAGEVREGTVPLVLRVADVARTDLFQDLSITLEFTISGDDFGTARYPQERTLDVDLNVSGGLLPTTYTEGFEGSGFGSFTTQTLDAGHESLATSDGFRCQYHDPDAINSNNYHDPRSSTCYLGAPTAVQNVYDWHVHGLASPDGGRAYLGNNSLHWGLHPGAASADTTRLRQLDAIRTNNTVNLGWNGVTPELSFKHQVGFTDGDYVGDYGTALDRGIVQVQLANSAGQGSGRWYKVSPYENVYHATGMDSHWSCTFDPTDDGSSEDDYFDPASPYRRLGPSSTCYPEFSFSRMGAIAYDAPFNPTSIGRASDGPGLQGVRGPGTWMESKFDLARYRGRRIRIRYLATSVEFVDALTMQQIYGWNPIEADDGWYIDDVRVSNTLTSAATVSVDTADRSGLPACGPTCSSVTASLVATPPIMECSDRTITLDASASTADQCLGGVLQFRFQWQYFTNWEQHAGVVQDWNESPVVSHTMGDLVSYGPFPYHVDVRCSTLPACLGRATTRVPMHFQPVPFPYSISFLDKVTIGWGSNLYFAAASGDLMALRANGGNFEGTAVSCLAYVSPGDGTRSSMTDFSLPSPGQAKYYLLRQVASAVPDCSINSYSTGSPAEVPGAGANRDVDLSLDANTCPPF